MAVAAAEGRRRARHHPGQFIATGTRSNLQNINLLKG